MIKSTGCNMEGLIECKNCKSDTPKCNRICTICNSDIGERCWRCNYLNKVHSRFCWRCNIKLNPTTIPLKNSIQPIPLYSKYQISSTLLINKSIIPPTLKNNSNNNNNIPNTTTTTNTTTNTTPTKTSSKNPIINILKKSNSCDNGKFDKNNSNNNNNSDNTTRSISPIKSIINDINNRTKDIEKLNALSSYKKQPTSLSWSNLNTLKVNSNNNNSNNSNNNNNNKQIYTNIKSNNKKEEEEEAIQETEESEEYSLELNSNQDSSSIDSITSSTLILNESAVIEEVDSLSTSTSSLKKPKLLYSSSKKKLMANAPPPLTSNTNKLLSESQFQLLQEIATVAVPTTNTNIVLVIESPKITPVATTSTTDLNNLIFIEKLNGDVSGSIENLNTSLNNSVNSLNSSFNFRLNLNSIETDQKRLSNSSLLDEIIDAFPSPPSKNPYISIINTSNGININNSNGNNIANNNSSFGKKSGYYHQHQPIISLPIPNGNSSLSSSTSSTALLALNLTSNINFTQQPSGSNNSNNDGNTTILIKSDHRTNLIKEIITTESDYVNDLEIIINVFCKPLREFISNEDSANIFSNIEQIWQINKQLYEFLISNTLTIGQVFSNMADSLQVYSVYCNYHQKSLDSLNQLLKTPQFESFFEQLTNKNELRGLGPHSFLIKPVQRICKYPLLLKELLKATAEDHFDYPQLIFAVEKIEKIVASINSQKKEMETWQRTMQLIQNLKGADNLQLLAANRHLISEGILQMVIGFSEIPEKKNTTLKFKKGVYFLFNDIFLFTKQKGTTYKLVFWTSLDSILIHANVSNLLPNDKSLFSLVEIGLGGRKWTFCGFSNNNNNSNNNGSNSNSNSSNSNNNGNNNSNNSNIINIIQKLIEKSWEDKFMIQNSTSHRLSIPSSSTSSPLSPISTSHNNNGASSSSVNNHSNNSSNNSSAIMSPNVTSKQSKKRNRRLVKSLVNIKT